jgi:hypothetical protein
VAPNVPEPAGTGLTVTDARAIAARIALQRKDVPIADKVADDQAQVHLIFALLVPHLVACVARVDEDRADSGLVPRDAAPITPIGRYRLTLVSPRLEFARISPSGRLAANTRERGSNAHIRSQ